MSSEATGELTGPAQPAVRSVGQWQRLHPLTPFVRGWKVVAGVLVLVGQQRGGELLRDGLPGRTEALVTLGVIAVVALLGGVSALLAWQRARYRLDEHVLELRTGVLFRKERQAPLDRLQAVDVVRPLLARFFGLAELSLEVAGSGDSSIKLSLLREADAQALRSALLAGAAGLRYEGEAAPEAPEHHLLTVSVGRTVESLLRNVSTLVGLLMLVVAVAAAVVLRTPGPLAGVVPVGFTVLGVLWTRFTGGFGFTVATSPDGVRLHHGLLTTRSQTVPPGRVQAVRLRQPLLWRSRDWWGVEVNVAGYGASRGGQDPTGGENILLTVGTRAEALTVAALALAELAQPEPFDAGPPHDDAPTGAPLAEVVSEVRTGEPQPAPAPSDDPLSRELIDAGLTGRGEDFGYLASPRSARLLDPFGWRRHGVRVTSSVLLVRRGVWVRELDLVPHARTQSLALEQGPLQRRLGVASFVLHSTRGPVSPSVQHLPTAAAGRLLLHQAERAKAARASAGHERWMQDR